MPASLGSKIEVTPEAGGGPFTLHCSVVMNDRGVRDVDNTNSSHSAANYDSVCPDNMVEIDIPWDDTNLPDTDVGLVPGTKPTVKVFDGSTGKFGILSSGLVKSHRMVRANGEDIIRSKVLIKGGVWTPQVT